MMLATSAACSLWIIFFLGSGVCARKHQQQQQQQHRQQQQHQHRQQQQQHQLHDDADDDESGVSRARCASRCLSLHRVAALSTSLQDNGSLGWCQTHKQCAKCLQPCRDSWETWTKTKKRNCRDLCERVFPKKHWECVASCEFLRSVLTTKQGSCPHPQRASGFAAACVESCDHDRECSANKKCCPNGCGHTCQSPLDLHKGVPLKPKKELSFEELPLGELKVHWSSRFNISAEPVVYILQRRWNFGIQPSEDDATSWQEITQTTEHSSRLSDVRPGRWYQFRVAAVNTHGTRGFTTPSRHVHSRREPSRPTAPTQLRVANMSFGSGRTASARLQWSSPADLDIPIHHYKVSWSWTSAGQSNASSQTKRRKTVRRCQAELDSIRIDRIYRVDVQAVSYWGQTPLKGQRAVLHFSTQHNTTLSSSKPSGIILDVGTPFYQDGQLCVHVYWQRHIDPSVEFYKIQWAPEYCGHNQSRAMEKTSTQESFVSLRGLLFSCKYKVLLQPVGKKSHPPAETTSFFTPSCVTIKAKSPKSILCPGETSASPKKVVVTASNLTASFDIRNNNVKAIFRWDVPEFQQQQLTGYNVTWRELVPTNRQSGIKMSNETISQSQILMPDKKVLLVSGLRPASVYRLEVKVFTAEGEGQAIGRTFQTPGYQSIVKQRYTKRKRSQKQPMIKRD